MKFAKRLVVFLLIIILLGVLSIYWPKLTGKVSSLSSDNENSKFAKEQGFVTKIVDGDTIHVKINGNDKEVIVRFLGINTPEKKKAYYQEAKDFLINEIENKSVELLQDGDDKDRYGRSLRYVFYENRLINVEIVEQGLATTFMLDELKYKNKFVNGEKFARDSGIGLWKKSSDKCVSCIKLVELKPDVDYFIIKNSCDFKCNLDSWSVKDDANHFFKLNPLESGQNSKYDSIEIFKLEVWNDDHDRFFMRDSKGELVLFYEY
jgi:micrococcal nuclease